MNHLELFETYKQNILGETDTFDFKCKQCGSCCRNREDILLSAEDVYRMSAFLKLRPQELIEKYCEVYIGQSSNIPVVRLLPKSHGRVCPLLKSGKCSVHQAKPTVCALFPLGRMMQNESKEINYFIQQGTCGASGQTHTVRDWLEGFDILESEKNMQPWSELIIFEAKIMSNPPRYIQKNIDMVNNFIYSYNYLNYDIEKPFLPQLESNVEHIKAILSADTRKIFEYLNSGVK